jgi:ubiquinone/menaquinone biosynthesis C-methylase UbiE
MQPARPRPLIALAAAALVAAVACCRPSAPRPAPADDLRPGGSSARLDGGVRAEPAASTATARPAGIDAAGIDAAGIDAAGIDATDAAPPGPIDGRYQGRPIADTCSYRGADWLDRPEREQAQQPERVLDALQLDPHSTVADVGAGTGYFTVRLARRVARVHATDIQPEMLERLADRLGREHLTNVERHLATGHDAALPARCCDLILLVDVYHELSDPPAIMAGIRRALTERGRLVLVEYRGEDPAVPIRPEHKMTLRQIQHELAQLGFHFVESLEFLPEQRIVIFNPAR